MSLSLKYPIKNANRQCIAIFYIFQEKIIHDRKIPSATWHMYMVHTFFFVR